ncbi:MAG: flavodoxin family protein [Methanothrix sp.]|jgi:multimeric flavodoxin WrbA|nr:flavodoxin family protein [Methanothrix sp.]
MRVLAVLASPRKGGNTEILVDEMLKGAVLKGHVAEKLRLYDYEILPCLDCRGCKREQSGYTCALSDGMGEIYVRLEGADLIIFGTPIYWYGPTAKMKLFIDRLRPYIASRKLAGKKGLIVTPSEEGAACCGPLLQMFSMSFDYLGMLDAGSLLAQAYERGEIGKRQGELERAREMGMSL